MPASYPSSAKTFTTKSDGAGNTILAAHINDLQLEVTAVESDLIGGLPFARGGTGATSSFAANRIPYSSGSAFTSAAGLTFDGTTLTAPATTITQPLTISGASAGQIVFPATQNASAGANTLDDYAEGSFVATLTGVSGSVTPTVTYTKIGNQVTINVPTFTGTSNTTAKTLTGMPAAIRPAANKGVAILSQDNGGSPTAAWTVLASTGTLTLYPNAAGGNWTASGTMEVTAFQMTYTLA